MNRSSAARLMALVTALVALSGCSPVGLPNNRITQSAGPNLQAQFDEAVALGGINEVTSFRISDGKVTELTGWVGESLTQALPSPHDVTEHLSGFYGGSKAPTGFDLAAIEQRIESTNCDGYLQVAVTPTEATLETAYCQGEPAASWLDGAALPVGTTVTNREGMSSLFAQAKAIAGDSFTEISVYETGSTFQQLVSSPAGTTRISTHLNDRQPPTIDYYKARGDDTKSFSLAAISGEVIWDTMAAALQAEGRPAADQVPFKMEILFGRLRADSQMLDRDVPIG